MSKYNNGIEKVPYHITKRLAKVFGCSVDYLNAKSNVRTEDTNIKQICNNIPLSEEFTKYVLTWERISNLLKYENMRWILNDIDLYIQHKFKLEKVSKSEVSNNTKIETNEFYKELGIISAITILLKQDMENLLEEIKNDEDNIYSNY